VRTETCLCFFLDERGKIIRGIKMLSIDLIIIILYYSVPFTNFKISVDNNLSFFVICDFDYYLTSFESVLLYTALIIVNTANPCY